VCLNSEQKIKHLITILLRTDKSVLDSLLQDFSVYSLSLRNYVWLARPRINILGLTLVKTKYDEIIGKSYCDLVRVS
jgi:hypothetical protein